MDLKNNKSAKNILLPIVVLVWGVVGYQFFDAFNPDEVTVSQIATSKFKVPVFKKKDTFSLLTTDVDPFLGKVYKKPTRALKTKPKTIARTPWPSISYFGVVSNKNASSSVYIVSINGQQLLLKKGDTIQKIKVLRGSNESIFIKYAGKTKEFTLM